MVSFTFIALLITSIFKYALVTFFGLGSIYMLGYLYVDFNRRLK